MSDYAPTTEDIRFAVVGLMVRPGEYITQETFDRWLSGRHAEKWDEGYARAVNDHLLQYDASDDSPNPYREASDVH